MKVLNHLLQSIRGAAAFNPEAQIAPACILWPDRDRQWEAVITGLKAELPELMVLGTYAPEKRIGPAIWLRCVIASRAEDVSLPKDRTPILYLPGVSRQDLRAVESCPDHLKPLAELQYRGVIWSQVNSKDWTILSYLKSDQGGLGLDVAQDNDARNSMRLALPRLLNQDVSLLKGKRLDKDYFNTLLTSGDPIRELLQWLDCPTQFQAEHSENEWNAFIEICKSKLAFNPMSEGVLAGCKKLANHKDYWHFVWERYGEAPTLYPNIEKQLRQIPPPNGDTEWHTDKDMFEGWPQWNDDQERFLQGALVTLDKVPGHEARATIMELEKQHGRRRSLVWAKLGHAPLADALGHLATIAEATRSGLAAGSVENLEAGYASAGWQADDGALRALEAVQSETDVTAVTIALRAVYLPWIEESARYLQKLVDGSSYPGGNCRIENVEPFEPGDCLLFVDGLRFDTGKRLISSLEECDFAISEKPVWAALPSVTATGKAAVTPVRERIWGEEGTSDFEPSVKTTGQSLKGGYHLKRLLTEAGWSLLDASDHGDGRGMGWCEFGDIDQQGHNHGWKLAKHIDTLIRDITERISKLFEAGWRRVRVVTDHGWLLMPGELPKIDLPVALAETKWGRCASLKLGATSAERLFPWYWNPNQYFALADGVSCFRRGQEYTHGGLSLQECLTLHLTVTRDQSAQVAQIEFTDVVWKGLRCTVAVKGNFSGLGLDIRAHAGDSSSSVIVGRKLLKDNGTASVVVEDEELQGHEAMIVLIDASEALVAQIATLIGGGKT